MLRVGLITAVLACCASAGAASLPDDLAQAAKHFDQAQMHGDGAALSRLLADDYVLATAQSRTRRSSSPIIPTRVITLTLT